MKSIDAIVLAGAVSLILLATPRVLVSSEQPLPKSCCRERLAEALPNHPHIRALAEQLLEQWEAYRKEENSHFDVATLVHALRYSAEKHQGQIRKDAEATPYMVHPLQVCHNLWEIGQVRNANILISALLHDTLEDTSATEEEIQDYFGYRVCQTIKEVTNDPHLTTEANKQRQIDHVPCMSQDARLVKLADRLANILDLRLPPPSWDAEKIEAYRLWGEKLLVALRGTNAPLEAALARELANPSPS